jgi:hypothetical protein
MNSAFTTTTTTVTTLSSSSNKRLRADDAAAAPNSQPGDWGVHDANDDDDIATEEKVRIHSENQVRLRRIKLNLLHSTLLPLVEVAASAYNTSINEELTSKSTTGKLNDLIQAKRPIAACKVSLKNSLKLSDEKSDLQKDFLIAQQTLLEQTQLSMSDLLLTFKKKEQEALHLRNSKPSKNFLDNLIQKELSFFPDIDDDIKTEAVLRISTAFDEKLLSIHYHHLKKVNAKPPAKNSSVAEDLLDKDMADATVSALIDKKLAPLKKQLDGLSKPKSVKISVDKPSTKNAKAVVHPAQQQKQSGKKKTSSSKKKNSSSKKKTSTKKKSATVKSSWKKKSATVKSLRPKQE